MGWLLVVGDEDITRNLVPEDAHGCHPVNPCPPFPRLGIGGGGAGWGVDYGGLVVAGAALGVHSPWHRLSDQVSPSVDGGYPDSVPCGGWALAVSGGEREAVVPEDLEEGVQEEVSDSPSQGGRLDADGCPGALGGAGAVEA